MVSPEAMAKPRRSAPLAFGAVRAAINIRLAMSNATVSRICCSNTKAMAIPPTGSIFLYCSALWHGNEFQTIEAIKVRIESFSCQARI
jgi:hypothetical protein